MNYNFPYYGMVPITHATTLPLKNASSGIFGRLLGSFNWGSLLTNTQKTLNLVNQAIPLIKQANPVIKNVKTMFRVMNEFKKVDFKTNDKENKKTQTNNNTQNTVIKEQQQPTNFQDFDGGPIFFVK